MKNVIALMVALFMTGAPAFAQTTRAHRAHRPRVAHHKKASVRRAAHPKKAPRKAPTPSDVVETPNS